MASLSAAHQSQHGTTAYRHFHQLNQSTVSGVVPTQLPLLFPSLAPSVDVSSVDPSFSVHHNLLLNHFLLSSAPSTSSSLLNPFTRSSLRPPYHSQTPHWLNLDGMAPLVKQFPSAAESFADRSLPQAKELGQQNQQQQCSVSSGVSSFSFSSSVSADSDGRSCSSGSCSRTHSLNMRQTNSDEQNANNDQIQTAQTAVQQHQRPQQIEPTQQKQKKLLVRDEAYWERRRKNNDAAKRSRDSRRKKEDEVAVRAVVLEQENLQLRFEVERLRTEIERHRIVAFGDTLIAATAENVGETSMGKMPISSAAITQLTTAATAMGMAKPILNT